MDPSFQISNTHSDLILENREYLHLFWEQILINHFIINAVDDRVRLLAQIEMDDELRRLREEQKKQVLPKPKINSNADEVNDNIDSKKLSSSEVVPAQPNIKVDNDNQSPKIQGGQDKSSQAQKRRDTVKAVRYFFFKFTI